MRNRKTITTVTRRRARGAFTLVELLVVMAIMAVLLTAVLMGGPALIDKTKANSTRAVLDLVDQALEQFKREEEASPRLSRAAQGSPPSRVKYKKRYGLYPPDELEVFTDIGLPGSNPPGGPLTPKSAAGNATVMPDPGGGYSQMLFYEAGNPAPELEHRDIAAMVLAIEMYGSESRVILDGIAQSNRSPGVLNAAGNPMLYLDRDDDGNWTRESDEPIRLIVDSWGNPISYFAQRDHPKGANSSNHPVWNPVASTLVNLNGNKPVVMSWGADGSDQLNKETLEEDPTALLIVDLVDNSAGGGPDLKMNNKLNLDNIFVNTSLKEELIKGIPLGPHP